MILCNDLKQNYELYQDEYENSVLAALRSGYYVSGSHLEIFEESFANYNGVGHCVGLNSGLDALSFAIKALDIGAGDEVIVPANTFIATVLAITENGAKPIFAEPNEFFNIDETRLESLITPRTKAIIVVHLYGQPCNMTEIINIAKANNLYIIEDCAQAHGATWNEKKVGAFGDIGCFSFYPTKPLGAFGDGGCVITDDAEISNKIRMLRNYGSKVKYMNESVGYNSRLDEVQAALLSVGLKHLDEGNSRRQIIASMYKSDINNPMIQLPKTRSGAVNVYHQFPILCERRDELQEYLKNLGIQTIVHYPIPPHLQQCYKYLPYSIGDFPIAEMYANQELSIPIYTALKENDYEYIVNSINSFCV